MCGIFGYCSDHLNSQSVYKLYRCRDTLRHRGPDMAGSFQDREVYLGFRRLANLDLSAECNQSMNSADGRYTIICNGKIYNFLELRSEFERQGEVF